jgi:NhaA family Na+:H+ antiporter
VAARVALGLVVGKIVGIMAGSWAATLSEGVTWSHLAGIAALGGIGFTVSLFISGLAFDSPQLTDAAKEAILGASTGAAIIGVLLLRRPSDHAHRPPFPSDDPSVGPPTGPIASSSRSATPRRRRPG